MKTINHECYVSFEVAKLLKEVGFDWKVNHYYFMQDGETETKSDFRHPAQNYNEQMTTMDSESFKFEVYSRPTLNVAQRWLREVKNCSVIIDIFVHNLDKNNIYYTYNWIVYFNDDRYSGSDCNIARYYEVAQEAGIKKALELILEKGE